MSTFTTSPLVGSRVLVSGTDVNGVTGSEVVSSAQWDEVNANTAYDQAAEAFDSAVEAFFAPLTEAAKALDEERKRPTKDPIGYVVLHEEVAATPGQSEHIIKLTRDSIVLRLIEQGESDRLVWVNGELEVLAQSAPTLPVSTTVLPADADPA